MLERVMRAITPAEAVPNTIAGRTKYLKPPMPPDGSHLKYTENIMINMSPHQKTGIDTPRRASVVET
jgi:hypothetical protein